MSQENVEVFRQAIEAYNRREVEAFLAAFDPRVEWRAATTQAFGGKAAVYRGHDGVRKFVREMEEAVDARIEYLEARDAGERIVVIGSVRVRGKTSGAATQSPIAWLAEFENGRVVRLTDYLDPQAALEAAGLEE
jgi:ketosteroid isomerase-like protein